MTHHDPRRDPSGAHGRPVVPRLSRPTGTGAQWLERDGFIDLAALELPDVDEVSQGEGDPRFHGHDEASLLELGEHDRCLDSSGELLRSGRMRARRRGLEEQARAARGVAEHGRQDLDQARLILAEARRELAPIAYRELSDRTYRRRKVTFGAGEAASLAVAFSVAFDVAPLEALLLSGAIAVAFVVAGDLGGILRLSADRARLSSALDRHVLQLHPRYRHIVQHDRRRWVTAIGCATAGLFALAAVSVGVLRASQNGSLGLAAGLGLLTVTLAMAAGLSSWQHASVGCNVIDHLQREAETAARRWRRAARARVLRRYDALAEMLDVRWEAAEKRGAARMRLAEARSAFFRARHPRVYGHGIRRPGPAGATHAANGSASTANGSLPIATANDLVAAIAHGSVVNGSANGSATNGHLG